LFLDINNIYYSMW